jgi:hypothetical protein
MRITLLACITCCLGAQAAQSQGSSGSLPMLHVEKFRPLSQPSSGFGPIHALASGLQTRRVDENAVALPRSLVASLSKVHVAVQALPPKEPVPQSGWLVLFPTALDQPPEVCCCQPPPLVRSFPTYRERWAYLIAICGPPQPRRSRQ